jgi:hypothetical protein
MDPALIVEAKRLREKYHKTKDYKGVYAEYRESGHWKALKSEMAKARKRECEICRSQNALNLHHLQYREWHDVWLDDLVWLCENHHNLIHDLGAPKGKDSFFLIRDTLRTLFEYENSKIVQELEQVKSTNLSLSLSLRKQKVLESPGVYEVQPSRSNEVKTGRGIPMWIVLLAVALSFGAGWLLKPSISQPEKAKPSRIERVK